MNLQEIKLTLIQAIANSNSFVLLERVQQVIQQETDPLAVARESVPASISLSKLKYEQGYDGSALSHWLLGHDHSVWADEDWDELLTSG